MNWSSNVALAAGKGRRGALRGTPWLLVGAPAGFGAMDGGQLLCPRPSLDLGKPLGQDVAGGETTDKRTTLQASELLHAVDPNVGSGVREREEQDGEACEREHERVRGGQRGVG